MGYYDTALVCRAGHVINDHAGTRPQFNKRFCPLCGQSTLGACENCNQPIQGDYIAEGVFFLSTSVSEPDPYCPECGQPYPWQAAKVAAGQTDPAVAPALTNRGKPARLKQTR
jgi:hypothetical protein